MKIEVNEEYAVNISFTQEQVNAFAEISGDKNSIHIDPEYAKNTVFGRTIIHGFLSGSVFSKVFGTEWPGEGTIYISQSLNFRAPAFVNELYTAKFKCVDIIREKHRGIIECHLTDMNGNIIIDGEAVLKHNLYF